MKIVVCIKQVPDTTEVKINPQTNTLIRDGVPSIINPFDLHAIEAALTLREHMGGNSTVEVLTMGPPQAEIALRDALSYGADDAYLLTDRAFAGSDTWATAYTLSGAIRKLGFDIIICGKQAIDGDTAQVGPGIAEFLGIPHVAGVSRFESISATELRVRRLMDDGYDVVFTSVPVLLTVIKELNTPRMPSLKAKLRAKKMEIKRLLRTDIVLEEKDLGVNGSPTQVKNIFAPQLTKDRRMIEGAPNEQAEQVVQVLKDLRCV
ncbi:MAG: electron transfer flavoprotein subunit beta/FixA family protein [Candidatus Magnetoovum sp. WYHC-5]|nr:electron transfer flavoprotein subunit beta/FixA family protein [Candidatus Magnetoovum sp. WYHC-5]